MRIHRLTIQAFGPFAGTEEIDFDEVGNAGLFLLDGPTGAGKSSILDAICYAIYGELPGNRHKSREIRSDHAAEGLIPEVCLELSEGERRFEVTRSPAWMRPSKRGKNKTTPENAKSSLREMVDGSWVALSTRNDEVGHIFAMVLGLDREQFTKVVMLPQGGFADFLRAKDTEREKLLARLFDTSDYARIEEEFATRLSSSRKKTEAIEAELAALESQVRSDAVQALETAGTPLPVPEADSEVEFDLLQRELVAVHTQSQAQTTARKNELAALSTRHTQSDTQRRVFARLAELHAMQTEHQQASEAATAATAALRLDQKARNTRPYQQQAEDALKARQTAECELQQAFAQLREADSDRVLEKNPVTLAALAAERDSLTGKVSVIRAALPEEQQRTELTGSLKQLIHQASTQQDHATAAEKSAAELHGQRVTLEAQDLDVVAATTAVHQAQQGLETAKLTLENIKKRDAAAQSYDQAANKRRVEADALDALQQNYLEIQRQLLAQGAVRLAAALKPGEPCLVCGATEHPAPATAQPGSELVQEHELDELDVKLSAQRQVLGTHEARVESLRTTYQSLHELCGDLTQVSATEAVSTATSALKQAIENQGQVTERVARVSELGTRIQELTDQATKAKIAATTANEQLAATTDRLEQLEARLEEMRAGHESLDGLLKETERDQQLVARAYQKLDRWLEAESQTVAAHKQWEAKRENAGFENDQQFQAALLEDSIRGGYERLYSAHQRRSAALDTLQGSADVAHALKLREEGIEAPTDEDLAVLSAELKIAAETHEAAQQVEADAASSVRRLREGREKLAQRMTQAGPVIEDYRRLKALAEVMRGAGENRLKMTLSTYVLAARLEEVAAAATERLQVMSSQRYSLQHDDSSRGNSKSGLGIRVHDAWTGRDRETQTLSGGETFMASLSLALGLADVISHHSGAVDMQTLFVDEGFGSLDAETLELVMEALETLRSGGRVIGVVSHVAEMKQRIINRLTVEKTRDGSTISRNADEVLLAVGGQAQTGNVS